MGFHPGTNAVDLRMPRDTGSDGPHRAERTRSFETTVARAKTRLKLLWGLAKR